MTSKLKLPDPKAVIVRARELINEPDQPTQDRLAVSDDYLQQGDWLHIIVYPREEGVEALDYLDTIEHVEQRLRTEHGSHILIVPSKPETSHA
jgi:hypothetical protein